MIQGADGERNVPMNEFHKGPWTTAVGEGEIVTEIRFALKPGAGSAHEKVERRAGDWAIAAASAALWLEGDTIADSGIALSAVGLMTIDLTRAEELLNGQVPSDDLFTQAGAMASEDCSPIPDGRGPVDYKRHLVGRAHETRPADRRGPRPEAGGLENGHLDRHQRRDGDARRRAAHAAGALHPRHRGPDGHALGL